MNEFYNDEDFIKQAQEKEFTEEEYLKLFWLVNKYIEETKLPKTRLRFWMIIKEKILGNL